MGFDRKDKGFKPDPAAERWMRMREHTEIHWRPTLKNLKISAFYYLLVPFGLYQLAVWETGRWNFRPEREDSFFKK